MSAIERLLVPGSTELPACHCGDEKYYIASRPYSGKQRRPHPYLQMPRLAPVRCGLLFGLPTRRLRLSQHSAARLSCVARFRPQAPTRCCTQTLVSTT